MQVAEEQTGNLTLGVVMTRLTLPMEEYGETAQPFVDMEGIASCSAMRFPPSKIYNLFMKCYVSRYVHTYVYMYNNSFICIFISATKI